MAARPPYSKRLVGETVAAGTSFTTDPIPEGKLWIVNCITYVQVAGALGGFLLIFAPGPLYLLDVNNSTATDGSKATVFTHQVIEAGETLTVQSTAASDWSVMISGYELSITP